MQCFASHAPCPLPPLCPSCSLLLTTALFSVSVSLFCCTYKSVVLFRCHKRVRVHSICLCLTYFTSIVVVHSLSRVQCFGTPWTAAWQTSLAFTVSQSLLRLMSVESVMPSNHLIVCHPLFLLLSIFPSIRVFFYESVLCIRWPKYWSFSFSIRPSNEY